MKNQKMTLVTGANKGIGQEVAKQLAQLGHFVIVAARNKFEGEATVAGIKAAGGEASFLHLDVSDEKHIRAAARKMRFTLERLDVLINNAGILLDDEDSVLDVSAEKVMQTLRTNTLGPLLLAQVFLPLLLKSASPRIVNVSSGAGSLTQMKQWAPAYSVSKTALNAVTRQLASALNGKNVAVNSVCPGWVRTRMGGAGASRSVEQGAETIVWLAEHAPQSASGKFFGDGKLEIPW